MRDSWKIVEPPYGFRRRFFILLPYNRRISRILIAILLILLLIHHDIFRWPTKPIATPTTTFVPLPLTGFVNTRISENPACVQLRHDSTIHVQQKSQHIDDDLLQIAQSLESHPMIDYSNQPADLTFEERVNRTWGRLSGSSVWLSQHNVFLMVTRIIFYHRGVRHWPVISFIRGQLFDKDWNELKGYPITCRGSSITFPTVFDIPAPYQRGSFLFGPEDPRIILEEGVEDAEPIVVFNMMSEVREKTRSMFIYRPFSDHLVELLIVGQHGSSQRAAEKNWAPFFHDTYDDVPSSSSSSSWGSQRHKKPNTYLFFVLLSTLFVFYSVILSLESVSSRLNQTSTLPSSIHQLRTDGYTA